MRHLFLISLTFLLAACGTSSMNPFASGKVTLIEMKEPREGAFSIKMPKDWNTMLGLERPYDQTRSCGFAKSPDGNHCVFFGDARMPMYYLPSPQYGMRAGMKMGNPLSVVRDFVPADQYFEEYARHQFGDLPGFRLTGTAPNPAHQELIEASARKFGMEAHITTASVSFEFQENGKIVVGRVNGATYQVMQVWVADVNGFMTTGDPQPIEEMLAEMTASMKVTPEWQEQENARHRQKMAAMEAQTRQIQEQTRQNTIAHNQRMQQMQNNFNAHQNRMADLQSSYDAHNQAWAESQGMQDRSHERFIDYIREEETVTNGSQTGKVQSGYNNYYVNPNTGEYIGTNSYENPDGSVYQLWRKKN